MNAIYYTFGFSNLKITYLVLQLKRRIRKDISMEISGKKVILRFFIQKDANEMFEFRLKNKDFFQKHSPSFEENYYTIENIYKTINQFKKLRQEDKHYTFGIFDKQSKKLVGDINLFQIRRGPQQRCLLGYSVDKESNGLGYATEAVKLIVAFAFEKLEFHRIEAGAMTENIGSIRVLEKAGFQREGIEREGVKINGKWEDHQIFSILSTD